MNPSKHLEIVRGSTFNTQKIIHELFEFIWGQQSHVKDLTNDFGSKNLSEIRKNSDRLKKQIQNEKGLMRKVESILNKQEVVLRRDGISNDLEIALEIRALLGSISDQHWSLRILKTTLVSLELRLDVLEENCLKDGRASTWFQ